KGTGGDRAWWAAQSAAVATFVEDDAAARRAFGYYRDRIFPREIRAEAGSVRAEPRRAPEFFSTDLDGITTLCRIAQIRGVDLWSARSRSGATLATLIDALEPALADPKRAREPLAAPESGAYFLAFAGMGLNRPDYVALFRKLDHHESAWLALVDLLVGRWEAAAHQTRH
ncbi:MAG: alginate lyase family protein, partial [Acidobacteriia bacterium]|nr:alginate lyase family protein [Terriglobia bacterium]